LVTYRCGKKNNHGDFRCKNKDVNRNYVERFVFDTIEKIVFDVSRIPRLVKRYNECLNELNTDANKRILRLHSNLKSINQKIDNIVGVIASTGSQALLDTLDNLEKEKQELILKIKAEEQS
jgi:site-specific DNA recombinase